MRRLVLPMVFALTSGLVGCLPNPQSEWVTSGGDVQRSTLDDRTFQAAGQMWLADSHLNDLPILDLDVNVRVDHHVEAGRSRRK